MTPRLEELAPVAEVSWDATVVGTTRTGALRLWMLTQTLNRVVTRRDGHDSNLEYTLFIKLSTLRNVAHGAQEEGGRGGS